MAARFIPIPDVEAVDELLACSGNVLLFLHDPACPISRAAHREMARLEGDVPLVDVRYAHEVTRTIAARTGIGHESPQVIVLRDGQAIWSASHRDITTNAVSAARG